MLTPSADPARDDDDEYVGDNDESRDLNDSIDVDEPTELSSSSSSSDGKRHMMRDFLRAVSTKRSVASMIGNVLEWFDFAVFSSFTYEIGVVFFPETDPMSAVVQAFGVFGAAFLARPLGGFLFGYVGDKYGRKVALLWSVILMAGTIGGVMGWEWVRGWDVACMCMGRANLVWSHIWNILF